MSAIARCTAASASGLTAVEPFTTLDTVERETPAAAATSSMVGLLIGLPSSYESRARGIRSSERSVVREEPPDLLREREPR
jgi:hypothetical protein